MVKKKSIVVECLWKIDCKYINVKNVVMFIIFKVIGDYK